CELEPDLLEDGLGAVGEGNALGRQHGYCGRTAHMRSIPTIARTLLGFILIMRRSVVLPLAIAVAVAAVSGAWRAERAAAAGKIGVAAAFYPVAFAAQNVGGRRVDVTNLTPVGAEPHDLEVTPDDLDRLLEAKVAFVLGNGFQPAVEKAARRRDKPPLE